MEMDTAKDRQLRLLTGMDSLGRTFAPAGAAREGKRVGMFFWLWIGQPFASGAYDAETILEAPGGADTLFHRSTPDSPDGQPHFWGRPLWGYYNSQDEWVIRRQLELLTLAGVDFIVFDATNAITYPNVYLRILATIESLQADGWQPPTAAFYTHSYSMRTAEVLYRELYQPGLFADAWYREDGKPVLIAYTDPEDDRRWARREMRDERYDPQPYPAEIGSFFRFYKPQWPLDSCFPDGFPWVEWTFPQPLHTDVMSVSVASHPNVPFSFTLTRGMENWGRGWDVAERRNRPEGIDAGIFFQSQWDHALTVDPATVFVGGWNEWIAYKQLWDGEYMLCDAASREFSRDIEPMEGGHGDAFYLQLIANIRRFKFDSAGEELCAGQSITYRALLPDEPGRDSPGVCPDLRYTQPAPPNGIGSVTVRNLSDAVEFDVMFRKPVSNGDVLAFQLLIGCGVFKRSGFEGYDWRVGPLPGCKGLYLQGFGEDPTGLLPVEHGVCENRLTFRVMRQNLGETGGAIRFKAAAYIDRPEDIMSYYTSGSALPPGRLSYVFPLGRSEGIE